MSGQRQVQDLLAERDSDCATVGGGGGGGGGGEGCSGGGGGDYGGASCGSDGGGDGDGDDGDWDQANGGGESRAGALVTFAEPRTTAPTDHDPTAKLSSPQVQVELKKGKTSMIDASLHLRRMRARRRSTRASKNWINSKTC